MTPSSDSKDWRTDYNALKAYGHSPAKAAEIVLDAKRGDFFCRNYIALIRSSTTSDLGGEEAR